MDIQRIKAASMRLGKAAGERYAARTKSRDAKLKKVEEDGVFRAAGMAAAVRRTAHMSLAEGRGIVVGAPSDRGKQLEAIVGPDDSDHVNFLLRGFMAARAVCRLTVGGQPVGTGFLVAPGLILTNNHVIGSKADATEFVAEFDYEYDCNDQLRQPIVRFNLDPERVFVTSDLDKGFDFTFVAVAPASTDRRASIKAFGWLPMDVRRDKILEGEPAVVVQHPRGEVKRLCLFASELVDRLDHYIHYTTDTDHGSSGSPVFNRSWQLVGLHHASTPTKEERRGGPVVVNEGIRTSTIIGALAVDSDKAIGNKADVLAALTSPATLADGRPQGPAFPPQVAPSAAAARPLDREAIRGNGAAVSLERTSIREHDAAHFSGRPAASQGYRETFLGQGELSVPLPSLPDALADDAARVTGGGTELKYTHFSVVFSTSRRLPIVTAANIDGAKSQGLKRTDRDYEAADAWYYDLRISKEIQLGPDVYDRTAFDYGHQVRREDPVWGDLNTSRMANDDTFHMTNCAPQHHNLNTKTWLQLENAVLQAAKVNKIKVSVFTGPVLSPRDPMVLDVQVPTAFWKVIAYSDGGRLRAHGFIQDQTRLVEDIRSELEALSQLDAASEYQVPIADIARVTSLDFGPLLAADELAADDARAGSGAGRPRRRRVDESLITSIVRQMPAASAAAAAPDGDGRTAAADGVSSDLMADRLGVTSTAGDDGMRIIDLLEDIHQRLVRLERQDGD